MKASPKLLQLQAAGVLDRGSMPMISGLDRLERSAAGDPTSLVVGDVGRVRSPAVRRVLDALGRRPPASDREAAAPMSAPSMSDIQAAAASAPAAAGGALDDGVTLAQENPVKAGALAIGIGWLVKRAMGW